jgi:hypothetical protein
MHEEVSSLIEGEISRPMRTHEVRQGQITPHESASRQLSLLSGSAYIVADPKA